MSYAALDAVRITKACKTALHVLESVGEEDRNEVHQRKTLMIQRIERWPAPPPKARMAIRPLP